MSANAIIPLAGNSKSAIIPGMVSIRKQIEADYYPKFASSSPSIGNMSAPVTIYEYVDFGCAGCKQMQPVIGNLLAKNKDEIMIIFKDLPTQDSYSAHSAARCAQRQGKFWQYADLLWQNQGNFSAKNLASLAQSLGLDTEAFNACLNDPAIDSLIAADVNEADNLGIPGTPHYYINKQEVLGVTAENEIQKIIDQESK